jgi:hypothetical protein
MQALTRLGTEVESMADEVRFEKYITSAREVDPTASESELEALALNLWGERFLEENPIFHRALSESLSSRLTENGKVDWRGKVPQRLIQKELDRWIDLLSPARTLTAEETASVVDLKNDVIFRMEAITQVISDSKDRSAFARSSRIQAAAADLDFYRKSSDSLLRSETERAGDWFLQSLGEAADSPAIRDRFRRELDRAGSPDKKLFGRYDYLSPAAGLSQNRRLAPSPRLKQALQLLRQQPGAFAISRLEEVLQQGTPEQKVFWLEHLLETAEQGRLPGTSGYTLLQLALRAGAQKEVILRASQLSMAPVLRESLEKQLLLLRMETVRRTPREIQSTLESYSFTLPDHPHRAPNLELIHQASLTEEVWRNPRFAEAVRVALPQHLLLLSDSILGALPPSSNLPLSKTQKTQLTYMLNSLVEARATLRDPILREQLDQNIFLICEKSDLPLPRWTYK